MFTFLTILQKLDFKYIVTIKDIKNVKNKLNVKNKSNNCKNSSRKIVVSNILEHPRNNETFRN